MSYAGTDYRKPARSRSQMIPSSSGAFAKKMNVKQRKAKPAWDNSVNDLSVHKLTKQGLQRIHELHKPKKDHERLLRKIESSKAFLDDTNNSNFYFEESKTSPSKFSSGKGALIKEVFCNQERELRDLLSETDKTFAEVEDIFGDNNVYKYKSIPVVTRAPAFEKSSGTTDISLLNPDNPTYYDTLGESMKELNASSLSDESSDDNDNGELVSKRKCHSIIANNGKQSTDNNMKRHAGNNENQQDVTNREFHTKVNIDHYQNLLKQNSDEVTQNSISLPDIEALSTELTRSIKDDVNRNLEKVCKQKGLKLVKQKQKNIPRATNALQTLNGMKKMLDNLEGEIEEYEKETGKENITGNVKKVSSSSTLSGYTANLLSMMTRLTHHLKQSEIQLKAEMAMRKEILDMFDDQRNLVDVLTNNLVEAQESNELLKEELSLQRNICQANHANLKTELLNLETRFNMSLFNPDNDGQELRKNFAESRNQFLPVWIEDAEVE